ncbi:MAG: twin-arginine translocase subunit TatB [Gammaproteobacteria bacterium]|nr:twin-arginine translocase subunit TatB [Gammaproteobacteria bacterium]
MFDIGFWELAIIGVVALIVIGPDKLPGVARTAGKWVGRTRRFVNQVKTDIDREIKQDELRKMLEKEAGLDEIKHVLDTDLDTNQYSFEEEKDYLVGAIDDARTEFSGSLKSPQDEPVDSENADDDGSIGLDEPEKIVKHERT